MIKVYMAHQNLGCFGISIGAFYADLYMSWDNSPRIYVNWFRRARYTLGFWFCRKW